MSNPRCIVEPCPDDATLMVDPDTGAPLVCRVHYQQWWRARKRNGEGMVLVKALTLPCRCGCAETTRVTGARRRAFEDGGRLPFASIACRDRGKTVQVPCAGDCGQMLLRSRKAVEASKTGRFICAECRAAGVGCKPRKGKQYECTGCGQEFYRKPGDSGTFHSLQCRRDYEAGQRVTLTCDGCGNPFEVWASVAARGRRYHDKRCWTLAQITNRVPGQWHNGKPKRYHKEPCGYVMLWEPEHPHGMQGWVFEHRYVVEQAQGAVLPRIKEVHHRNEVKDDNRLENLEVLDKREHSSITGKSNWRKRKALEAEVEEYRRRYGTLADAAEAELRAAGYRPIGELLEEATAILAEHGTGEARERIAAVLRARGFGVESPA